MEKNLIILRGLPGSGKSTLAKLFDGFVCTADDYHMKNGKYEWKLENAGKAHFECQAKVEWGMKKNAHKIIVANTSTTEKEMKPYYDLANKYGYRVFSVICENRHNGKNTHNVPQESIQKMLERFSIKLI
jgi:predicted kinase